MRRIIGIIILVIGIGLIGLSMYIQGRVEEGKGQISEAQRQVDTGTSLFNVHPITEEVGKELSRPAQKKINRARFEADQYAQMAHWLKIGGIVLIVIGVIAIIIPKKRSS